MSPPLLGITEHGLEMKVPGDYAFASLGAQQLKGWALTLSKTVTS